jgi:hypothetical protein
MAGMVCTVQEYRWKVGIDKIVFLWTSDDTAGTATAVTANKYTGELIRFVTDPLTPAPTDNYDIEILDSDSVDVLIGAGANRHTTATQQVIASLLGCCFDTVLTLSITNAGNSKKGLIALYIRKYPLS